MKTPEFACGTSAYLNNASVSPMPVESIKAVSEFFCSQMGPEQRSAESEPFVTNISARLFLLPENLYHNRMPTR